MVDYVIVQIPLVLSRRRRLHLHSNDSKVSLVLDLANRTEPMYPIPAKVLRGT